MGLKQGWYVIKESFKTGYEYIGIVMLANLLWFGLGFAPLLIVTFIPIESVPYVLAGFIGTIFTLGGATAAVHYMMNKLIQREETTIKDFWAGFKKFFGRGSGLFLLGILGFVILIADLMFSINNPNNIIRYLSGIWVWGMLYWYALLQFVFPFLTQQDKGLMTVLKRAALVSLDNILGSLIVVVISILLIVLSLILAAPILLFTMSLLALIQNYALNEILLKYEKREAEAEEVEEVEQ
ncbi:MAG: YesL family protein [Firmicutes bacterium]|nr:YesL family protein [Bacillota bacterium]